MPAANDQVTMSTREIAELCGKQHKNVKRDFSKLCSDLELGALKFEHTYLDIQNKTQTEYLLDKELTLTLVSGYNTKMRFAIIKRWQELESQVKQPLASEISRKDLALMIIKSEEEKEALAIENKVKTQQIETLNDYFTDGQTAPDFAKGLNGVNTRRINTVLIEKNWLFKSKGGELRVTSYARDRYMTEQPLKVKVGEKEIIVHKPVLLEKGAAKITTWYSTGVLNEIMKQDWNGMYMHKKVVA